MLQNRKGREKRGLSSTRADMFLLFSKPLGYENIFSIRIVDVYFPFTRIPLGRGRKWSDVGGRLKQYQNI